MADEILAVFKADVSNFSTQLDVIEGKLRSVETATASTSSKATSDFTKLAASIETVSANLESLESAKKKATDAKSVEKINTAIAQQQDALEILKSKYEKLKASTDKTGQSTSALVKKLEELGAKANAVLLLDKSKDVIKTIDSVQSLRTQIRNLQNEAAQLKLSGLEDSDAFRKATSEAAALRATIDDVNKSIDAVNPQERFNSIIQVTQGVAGAFRAAGTALVLLGGEGGQTKEILETLQKALIFSEGVNSASQLAGAFKNLKAALGITTAATAIQATANEGLAASEATAAVGAEGAAVATRSFTAALLTNPIFLAVAAISALAGVFVLLKSDASEADRELLNINNSLKQIGDVNNANSRLDKEFQDSIQGQIDLLKAKGATDKEVSDQEGKLLQQRANDLNREKERREQQVLEIAKQQDDLLKSEIFDAEQRKKVGDDLAAAQKENEERLKELPAAIKKANNEILVSQAQFTTDQLKKQKELQEKEDKIYQERAEAKRNLELKLREIGISLISDEFEKRKEQAKLAFDKELDQYSDLLDKKKIGAEGFSKVATELQRQLNDNISKIDAEAQAQRTKAAFDNLDALAKQVQDNISAQTEIALTEEVEKFNKVGDFSKEAQKNLSAELEQIKLQGLKEQRDSLELEGRDTIDLNKQIADQESKINQDKNQELIDSDKEAAEKRKIIIQEVSDNAIKVYSLIFDFIKAGNDSDLQNIESQKTASSDKFDSEAAALEKQNERKFISDRVYEEKKADLLKRRKDSELKLDAEMRRIKTQQAQADKTKAIFDTIINTAVGITKALPNVALVAFTAILGAAQLALITAQPLPKFKEGISYLPLGRNKAGTDTIPVMADEGERIVSKKKNLKNWEIYEALDKNKFKDLVQVRFVAPALIEMKRNYEQRQQKSFAGNIADSMFLNFKGLTASDADYIRRKGTYIKNGDEIADKIADRISSVMPNKYYGNIY